MTYQVALHRRAEEDLASTATWISRQSPEGAAHWLDAYDRLVDELRQNPLAHGLAPEDEFIQRTIRQAFFKTRRGKAYRIIFTIEGDEIRILRVRGPGQAIVPPDELGIG